LFEKAVIEITEGSDILEEAVELLNKRYTANRAEIALDDYGTGYSNESNLIKIQPHYIKIDRSLITNINTDMQKQHLVSNMINFATQHGIKVLAEGC
jgi:EAL domain-containing protein (putative c-di-GMP-specific phosphodiesterase class I)